MLNNNSIYFVVEPVYTVGCNSHIQAYEIKNLTYSVEKLVLISQRDLINVSPSNVHYTSNGLKVITLLQK